MSRVFVLGSVNMDLTVFSQRVPKLGESVIGEGFMQNQGGKGANQAVACSKLGCDCQFIGAVGNDGFGKELVSSLKKFGVKTDALQIKDDVESGACVIVVDNQTKDNMLVVSLGANARVDGRAAVEYLEKNGSAGDIFISQLEINLDAVQAACRAAKEMGMFVILNPAPATKIGGEILSFCDLVIPNETEAELLVGVDVKDEASALKAFDAFRSLGAKELIVTLGSRGSVYVNGDGRARFFPIVAVKAVDPTCAGDTFVGALASKMSVGVSIEDAIPFAAKCSAITVSRKGAACSVPTIDEVE